ncbi:MAG: hypothetical protein IAE91_06485 [Ignavibacteriaceae bacterium]|nr:hypothetical protein [Ignavibacteriaceae bacterium]
MIKNRIFVLLSVLTLSVVFLGCPGKKDEPKEPVETKDTTKVVEKPVVEEPKVVIPDFVGSYSGAVGNMAASMTVSKQDSITFTAVVTIASRTPVVQNMKGSYDPDKKTVKLTTQETFRYNGDFSGTLSEDGKSISGTYVQRADNASSVFKLTKQ